MLYLQAMSNPFKQKSQQSAEKEANSCKILSAFSDMRADWTLFFFWNRLKTSKESQSIFDICWSQTEERSLTCSAMEFWPAWSSFWSLSTLLIVARDMFCLPAVLRSILPLLQTQPLNFQPKETSNKYFIYRSYHNSIRSSAFPLLSTELQIFSKSFQVLQHVIPKQTFQQPLPWASKSRTPPKYQRWTSIRLLVLQGLHGCGRLVVNGF